jgi:flavin-dependent thymidylate synthase
MTTDLGMPVVPAWLEDRRQDSINEDTMAYRATRPWEDTAKTSNLLADVAFNRHSMNDGHHVSPSDNGLISVGADHIQVNLVQGINEDMLRKTLSKATRATIGFNLDAAEDEDDSDWEEMLKGGLQTALETQVIIFEVSGVSRTCTHQLVRSRKASFHQQSQRASYAGDAPEVRMPESVWRNPQARQAFLDAIEASHEAYRIACESNISYQDARFVLPEGTTSYIMLEYSIREFMNVYAYRGCSMFQWEIVDVMRKCRAALVEAHPFMEPYVKISCEKTGPAQRLGGWMGPTAARPEPDTVAHHCTFQGWESPEGQCDFSWAKDWARTFKPAHHAINKGSA